MWFVYVLRSERDGDFYTGSTCDLERRLKQHKNGEVPSTKERRPLKLVYYEVSLSQMKARKREMYLKTSWGKRYLKKRV